MDEEDSTSLFDKFKGLLDTATAGYKAYTTDELAKSNEDLAARLAAQNNTANATPAWLMPVGLGVGALVLLLVVASMFTGKKN